jgi:hypothetical protein
MKIISVIKPKRAKKECDRKCKEYIAMAQTAISAGDHDFAKECIHKQVETEMKYKEQYIFKNSTIDI